MGNAPAFSFMLNVFEILTCLPDRPSLWLALSNNPNSMNDAGNVSQEC